MSEEIKGESPATPAAPVLSIAEQAAELQIKVLAAQLEDLQLQKQEREYSVQDLRARLGDRSTKELQKKEDRESQGRTFAVQKATDDIRQSACTHKKGGVVTPRDMRVLHTGGNGQQYAVYKHQMINGDIWVRCLRCGKTWAPPIEINFYVNEKGKVVAKQDGKFDVARFNKAVSDYQDALKFETNNSMSASVQCRFQQYDLETGKLVDAADVVRNDWANTNLR